MPHTCQWRCLSCSSSCRPEDQVPSTASTMATGSSTQQATISHRLINRLVSTRQKAAGNINAALMSPMAAIRPITVEKKGTAQATNVQQDAPRKLNNSQYVALQR